MVVIGVDGCPGGWLAVRWAPQTGRVEHLHSDSVIAVLDGLPDASAIAIDIPIGLNHCKSRACDIEARRLIKPRHNSVFPAPDARVVHFRDYLTALAWSRDLCGKGISRQVHAIFWRIHDANNIITPGHQDRVVEVHPELSFWALNSKSPLVFAKRSPEGFEIRRLLLQDALGIDIPYASELRRICRPAEADDVLDVMVAAWTAHRLALGIAERIPDQPESGVNGLRMEMVY
ncbi:DUF429 domain-containing protein [soil metagenome]